MSDGRKIDPRVPDFLKHDLTLQRRYLKELRTTGCNGCGKGELDRKYFRKAGSQSLDTRRRKR